MQNEITELRNQVRTLKRIVYGFGCLLVAGFVVINKLRGVLQVALLLIATVLLMGCGKGCALDYGQPTAQFLAKDLPLKAKTYVGKKITVKGTVTRVDISDPNSSRIYLKEGIECNLGTFKAMATSCKIGDTVFVDGFLKRCDDGDILIEPALLRDPTAEFIAN